MPLASCLRCKKMFDKVKTSVCLKCLPAEEEDYDKIRASLDNIPNQTAEDLAETTGVEMECVLRLLNSGRIQTIISDVEVKCGKCGAPAISVTKRLCEACLRDMNAQLAREQSKIKLGAKKKLEVGTALNTFRQREEADRGGGTKYRRS